MSKEVTLLAGDDRAAVRSTINLIQTPVYLIDVDVSGSFRFFAVNTSEEHVIGLEREEIEDRSLEDVLDREFAARRLTALRQCVETRSTVEFESFVDRSDGRDWGKVTLVPLFDTEERLIRIMGMARDVTDHERTTQGLQRTIDELREQVAGHVDDEQRFERVFQDGPMGMVVVDLETRVLEVNRAFCLLLGYTPAELIGKKSSYFTHPDDLGINAEVVDTLLGGKIPIFHGEKRYIRKNGNTVWARVTGTVIQDEDGKPEYGLGMVEDISYQRYAEETIRRTNRELQIQTAAQHEQIQRFDRVFEMGPIGMCVVGPDLKFSRVNKSMCEFVGYTEEELTGLKVEEITHPDDVNIDVALAGQLFREQIPFYQIEKRYIRKDGSIRWGHLTASMVRDEAGTPLYGLGMVKDIHERKVAEEAASRVTRLFKEAEEISGFGSWEVDMETDRLYCSAETQRMYRLSDKPSYTRDEVRAVLHPEDRGIPLEAYADVRKTGEPTLVEYRLRFDDGTIRHLQVRSRLEFEAEQPVRLVGVSMDITEKKRVEESAQGAIELFKEAEQIAGLGSWEADLDTGKLHCSEHARRIFGLDPDQPFYSPGDVSDTVHPDDRDIPLKGNERLLATGEPIQVEYRILPGGELRHVQVRAKLEMKGGQPK